MDSLNVGVYKIQMAYFFRERSEIRAFGLSSSLYSELNDVFKTEPQSFPVPEDAPNDMPRCIWNDVNSRLMFTKERLDFIFNIPTKDNWENMIAEYNEKIVRAIDAHQIAVDRVGAVSELMSADDLHKLLNEQIEIERFRNANEANISWLEKINGYNVWTYFTIDELKNMNKIVIDVNSTAECKLSDQGISGKDAMYKCTQILKGKMKNVL